MSRWRPLLGCSAAALLLTAGAGAQVAIPGGQPDPAAAAGRGVRRHLQRSTPSTSRLQPSDLLYLGAFRLPDRAEGAPEVATWDYGGQALTYRPDGDLNGAADGFPGSLFGTGLDTEHWVSEIDIPPPAISPTRDLAALPTASTLQPFVDLRGTLFTPFTEIPRVGLAYLDTTQTGPRLHMAWGQHFQEDPSLQLPSHAWCDPTLSTPHLEGAWWIGDASLYAVNGYLFEIPEGWATAHVGGRRLATGRFRDGGWSGMGPALFAYAPWLSGNPPAPGTRLTTVPLLLYSSTLQEQTSFHADGYQHCDEWEGGAWITTPSGHSAVVFAGTKGVGEYYWYGWLDPSGNRMPCVEMNPGGDPMCFQADGSACPPALVRECAGHTSERGWWSARTAAQILFYDPADLAAVAAGTRAPHEPQPYAVLTIDDHLFLPDPPAEADAIGRGVQRRFRLGETAFDRARGHLFVVERFGDGTRPLIHVWKAR
ncbi:MAG TPA: hypothetical protein PLS53_10510 [Thermoanaerobaculaceae bacterium]|nr:hypothetical protein [Thermoanaerobaculaceae bacterium]HPS78574.1 hypothetical protein [Thermoanaerobaculaceae bacterium]